MPQPVDSGGPSHPRLNGCSCIAFPASGAIKTLGVRNKPISKLYQHFRVRGHPCGLQDSLCTLRPSIVRGSPRSAMDATLDTGGWLTLTPPGLSPAKIRQASWRDNARLVPPSAHRGHEVAHQGVVRPHLLISSAIILSSFKGG